MVCSAWSCMPGRVRFYAVATACGGMCVRFRASRSTSALPSPTSRLHPIYRSALYLCMACYVMTRRFACLAGGCSPQTGRDCWAHSRKRMECTVAAGEATTGEHVLQFTTVSELCKISRHSILSEDQDCQTGHAQKTGCFPYLVEALRHVDFPSILPTNVGAAAACTQHTCCQQLSLSGFYVNQI